ncbi:MAG: type I pullulanase [Oscillospiraceae bacterium]|nr:type I pullulanase [Oscillospiraceae bacterium]
MHKRTYAKRLLSFVMALVMVLSLLPMGTFAAEGTRTIYLNAGGNGLWDQANAWFDAWVWGSSQADAWYTFTDEDHDGVYQIEIPEDATGMKILRKDPASKAHDWNKWNETGDLTLGTNNMYTITGWNANDGKWSEFTGVTYTIAGTISPAGWVPADGEKLTEKDGVYSYTYTDVAKGTYEFKVVRDANWSAAWPSSNYEVTVEEDGCSVTVTFNPATQEVKATVEAPATSLTVYFRNDWLWTTPRIYAWGGDAAYTWPGEEMTKVDTVSTEYGDRDVYSAELPLNVTGFLFNGPENGNPSNTQQTPDVTTIKDGAAYYIYWDNANKVGEFTYPEGSNPGGGEEPEDPGVSTDVEYAATFHFANTLGWGAINLYTWTQGGANPTGAWPGSAVAQGADGFYTATVTYKAPANQGLNFIFNNGGTQTVDLALDASAFDSNHKAEVWVVLSDQTDGKYNAEIYNTGDAIAVSPVVQDNSVTFQYKAPGASSVEVRGTMCGWGDGEGVAMTKNSYGIWSVTINNISAGIHEYKFVADGAWVTDPLNTWQENGNSAFLISDPSKDVNLVKVIVHYNRTDGNYNNWNLYMWNENGAKQYNFTPGTGEVTTTIAVAGRSTQSVNFKVRKSVGSNQWAAEEAQVTVDLSTIVSGTIHVYTGGKYANNQTMENDVVFANKISDVQFDYEKNTVTIVTNKAVKNPQTAFGLTKDGGKANWTYDSTASGSGKYVFALENAPSLSELYRYTVRFYEQAEKFHDVDYTIGIDTVYATDKFAAEYTYTGSDLGANWTGSSTTFRLWAPTAESASVALYATGSDSEEGAAALGTFAMSKDVNGTWIVTIKGDLRNVYYTYSVKVNGKTIEANDPYSQATGVNGKRSMVVNLDSTDPDGWENDTNPNPVTSQTDAVIYELHIRDFSIDASSGVTEANRGRYLAFTEQGTTVKGEGKISTGIDYLKNLGVTHVHLLPMYDYASVDESGSGGYNWGYDPQNYNVPEGSYSTNPYDGNVRINEAKQMVQSLHKNGISVVMDVVYNHVYDASTFSFNQIVPGYFSRVDSNRSGCGNDTASEREMVRKYIVESVLYWTEEYHIDGFRFDLVGLLDVQTINQIIEEVHAVRPDVIFYGEGWDMDSTNKEPGTEMAKQGNASKTPGFAYFSDNMRNLLAGDNGKSTGFVSGAAGQESALVSNFMARPWWTDNPNQVVQYASCHDNHTLADKLIISTGKNKLDSTIIKMNNLSAAIYMTSQGIPFIHAGEEILREKLDANGNRIENSYNSSDKVNHIAWYNLDNSIYQNNVAYYQGLIAFRKAHPALRVDNAKAVSNVVFNQSAANNLVSFWIDGREVAGETHDSIYIIFNASSGARSVELPEGKWQICVNGTKAGTEALDTVSGTVNVAGISALILVQEESTQEPTPPAPKSNVALPGSFNGWNTATFMDFAENSTTVTTLTLSLPAGEYEFKVKNGDTWLGNGGTINDSTDQPWKMDSYAGNCKLQAAGGAYTFTYDTVTEKLTVTYDPNGGDFGSAEDYYLYGWINGADYATGIETGDLKFDEDGKLTTTFASDSYVCVKNGDSTEKYMTKGWLGSVTEAVMYNVAGMSDVTGYDKLMVPGGSEVTFTLVHNDDGTVTLSYTINVPAVVDGTGVQDGVTLHCWNWSFAEIEKNMATIAAQGYSAIQTSPIQPLKEATNLSYNSVGGNWWVYYQPVDFVIADDSGNALGTKKELQSMINTAHKYGVKVIVDVVANHLANTKGNDLSKEIPEYLRDTAYWHDITVNTTNWNDRYDVTQHCMGGLPDLNTGNEDIQQFVLEFLKDCVDMGVDGFRFDAAKHIETPMDDVSFASDFWPTIVGGAETYADEKYGKDLYIYGELLDTTGGVGLSAYTQYMAITDNSWGNSLRKNIEADKAALSAGYDKAADASVLVLWAESHDTYMTDDAYLHSGNTSLADIQKTWALVAARADAMGLYFARPESLEQAIGVASVTGWADREVAIINRFHNTFAGQDEVVSNENGVSYVERGTTGAVLVLAKATASRSSEISVTAHALADGQYTEQITGNIFTVANGKITGQIGDSGIAVLCNELEEQTHKITVEQSKGGKVELSTEEPAVGQSVTITATPDEDKQVDKVQVTDSNGNEVAVKKNSDGTYSFTQPDSDVTVKVTFADQRDPSSPPTGDEILWPSAVLMVLSAAAIVMLTRKNRKKEII